MYIIVFTATYVLLSVIFTAPDDYLTMSNVIIFTNVIEENDFPVPLIDDELFEDTEHFFARLSLVTASLAVQLDPDQARLEIVDNSGTI